MKHHTRARGHPPFHLVTSCLPILWRLHAPACTCECTHASPVHLVSVWTLECEETAECCPTESAAFRKDARMSLSHKA